VPGADRTAVLREIVALLPLPPETDRAFLLAVLEAHKANLLQQRTDIEAQLSELQAFEKRIRKQLKHN